jgi:uncharacterized membrane protein YbhN (UPF0104 family)
MKRLLLAVRGFVTSKRFLSFFGHFLVLLVFLGAARLLYREFKKPEYSLTEIKTDLRWLAVKHTWWVVVASLLTVLNFVILVGYDWFAVRYVGEKKLPLRKIALASFITYAFSLNFGASLFGTSIRYRLYSAWGMPLIKIIELLVILGLTFWFGVFTLAGVVFTVRPFEIPVQLLEKLELHHVFHDTFWVGAVLLTISGSYVLLSAFCREPIRLWRWKIPVPPLKLTLYQIAIACGDLIVAAAVLYALLPHGEVVQVRMIVCNDVRSAEQVRAAAAAAPDSFGELAKEYSKDANSAASMGAIPPIHRYQGQKEFKLVARAMSKGEISRPIKVGDQYLILKCDGDPTEVGYVRVLGVWMLAYVAVVITHVPGGYGVQEWVVLAFWPGNRVLAALIVFRVIYYWVPLAIASALLGGNELLLKNVAEAEPTGKIAAGSQKGGL